MRFFLGIVLGFFLLSDLHGRGGFHVHRSYDLDNNGLKEVLVLNARNISAMWIETSLSGDNDTLWSYSLENNGTFADGEVVDINQVIVDDPAKINEDPEGTAWFFKLKMKDISELDSLMNKEEYDKFAKESSS